MPDTNICTHSEKLQPHTETIDRIQTGNTHMHTHTKKTRTKHAHTNTQIYTTHPHPHKHKHTHTSTSTHLAPRLPGGVLLQLPDAAGDLAAIQAGVVQVEVHQDEVVEALLAQLQCAAGRLLVGWGGGGRWGKTGDIYSGSKAH